MSASRCSASAAGPSFLALGSLLRQYDARARELLEDVGLTAYAGLTAGGCLWPQAGGDRDDPRSTGDDAVDEPTAA